MDSRSAGPLSKAAEGNAAAQDQARPWRRRFGTDSDDIQLNGSTLIARRVDDVDKESLRALADTLKSRLTSGVIVLAAPSATARS